MTDDATRAKKAQLNRAYTQGMHLKKKPAFVFNEDGTIKGIANEKPVTPK
jgi:hypothetical protein